jgi:PAS domain S-box-containing protein
MLNLRALGLVGTIRILHVDDDASFIEISKQILLDVDDRFNIDDAFCVDEAAAKLATGNYDLVISDYEMPSKNGLEFLKEIREQGNEIPFILFTGKGREDVAIAALNLGSDAYVNKQGAPETVYGELYDAIIKTLERKTTKKLLTQSEAKYRKLVEKSFQGILIAKVNPLSIVFANEAMGKILKYTPQELTALSPEKIMNLVYPDDKHSFVKRLEKWLRGEPTVSCYEFRAIRKDGTIIWLNEFANQIDYEGQPAIECMFLDITKHIKLEKLLIESEEKFRNAFTTGPDAFLITSLNESTITEVNERFLEIFGHSRQEVIGKKALAIDIWANPSDRQSIVNQLLSEGKVRNREVLCKRKNGAQFPVLVSVSLLQANNQRLALSVVRDVSSYKQTQAALREIESHYRLLTENMHDVIWTMNLEGHFTYVSPSVLQLRGYTPEEVMQQTMLEALTPSSAQLILEGIQRFWETGSAFNYYELEQPCKNGSNVWTEVNFTILRDKTGEPESILGVSRDITERKKAEAELKNNHAKLEVVNEKLHVVGSLTRHDVRNKLSVVTGNAYLLKKKLANQADIVDSLKKMETACKEIGEIFEFARIYEQLGVEELTYLSVTETLNEAVALFSGFDSLELINECHGLTLLADSFLRQLFYNLIDNSLKHGMKVSKVRLCYEKRDQDTLILVYEDNGVGISDENRPGLFKEGFSTIGSSGYGLFLINQMIGVYGWGIQEKGEFGKGVKFEITISKVNQKGQINYKFSP